MVIDTELNPELAEDLLGRLEHPDNIAVRIKKEHEESGKKKGDENIPGLMRELVADLVQTDGVSKVAEEFGIAPSTASNYGRGLVSGQGGRVVDKKLIDVAKEARRERIVDKQEDATEKATDLVLQTFGLIEAELNSDSPVTKRTETLTRIARNLASVGSSVSGRDKKREESPNEPRLTIITVGRDSIDKYEVVDIG